MIRTLKATLGLGLLAALAMTAMSVVGASANTSGHFTQDSGGTAIIDITENTGTAHQIKFHAPTLGTTIECHHPTYEAKIGVLTTQEITVTPQYTNCTSNEATAIVRINQCDYKFTSRTIGHATTHFFCPAGAKVEIEVPSSESTFTIGAQTPSGGATYTTTTENTKHAITANITVTGIHYECHGFCAIFGTTGTNGEMTGSATIKGTNSAGNPINLTAT